MSFLYFKILCHSTFLTLNAGPEKGTLKTRLGVAHSICIGFGWQGFGSWGGEG